MTESPVQTIKLTRLEIFTIMGIMDDDLRKTYETPQSYDQTRTDCYALIYSKLGHQVGHGTASVLEDRRRQMGFRA